MLLVSGDPPSAGADTASFGSVVPRRPLQQWLPEEFATGHTYTQTQAVTAAQRYDVIVAYPQAFGPYVGAMRAANPHLVLLAYMNGMFVGPTQTGLQADWYSYDANGARIQNVQNHNWLMSPSSPGWVQSRVNACSSLLAQSGYDGCMLDTLGVAPLTAGYCTALPVNPATAATWTRPDWIAATTQLAQSVRSAVSPSLVVGNGLKDGPSLAESSQLFNGMDGGIAEGFLRTATQGASVFPGVTAWQQNVNMLVSAPKPVLALTKLWASATSAQLDQWHVFALASFLLGTDGRSSFFFSSASSEQPIAVVPWTVDIGDPAGGYALQDGVYQRPFSGGRVLVNPGASAVTVPLPGSYTAYDGTPVSGSLAMAPDTGAILKGAPASAPDAPVNVSASAGDASASVSFSAPASDGGSAITGYTVTASDATTPANGGQTASGSGSPIVVAGLTNGDSYAFTVTATNAVGTSPASAPSNAVVPAAPASAPDAPVNVSASAGDASASVSFSAPASDGGSAITGYTVTASDATTPANGGQTASGSGSPIVVAGLTNGDSYAFTVTATNAVGTSPASAPSNAVTPVAPAGLTVTTTAPDFAVAKVAYSYQLAAGGGTAPYTWSLASGALPSGLTLAASGAISGTPASTGTSSFSVTVCDASSPAVCTTAPLSLAVYKKPANGSGTAAVSPASVAHSSNGNVLTIVYTAPSTGALYDGGVRVAVPTGWTAPSTATTSRALVTTSSGTISVINRVIAVAGLHLAPGASVTITYGTTGGGLTGVTAPSATGVSTFKTREGSTATAALALLASSPTVTVT